MPALKYWDGAAWKPLIGGGVVNNPPGTLVRAQMATLPDINTSTTGIYDVVGFDVALTYPYPTRTVVIGDMTAGFGGGTVTFHGDLYAIGSGTSPAQIGNPTQAVGGVWVAAPMTATWTNASNVIVGGKLRINFLSGSNIHTGGSVTWMIYAT